MTHDPLPLVLVPGHLCDVWLYAPQIARVGATRPVSVADVTMDDDLAAMADRLLAAAPPRFAILGLSMGGMVAMEAMARAPGRIAGALLLDTDPSPARERERAWRAALRAQVASEGLQPFLSDFVPKFFAHSPAAAEAHAGAVLHEMTGVPVEVFDRQSRALDARRDLLGPLAGLDLPVGIAVGAEDRVCPPKLHEALAAVLPAAELEVIPGCGHLATLEAPEAVGHALDRLLARADP